MLKEKTRKWLVGAIAAITVLVVAGCGESSTPTSATTSSNQPSGETQEAAKPSEEQKPVAFKLNQEAKAGNLSYVVTQAKKTKTVGNEFLNKKTEEQFVMVKVKVKNNDKESRTIDTNLFKIKDNQGREFSADVEADIYVNNNSSFFLEQVNPGTSRTGYIVFEIPKDAKGLTLEVSSGLGWSGGEYAIINLGM